KSFIIPTWMAENSYRNQVTSVDFKFTYLPFSDIKDEDIKVTDDDLKKYLKQNSKKYEQEEETRRFEYVTFNIEPSGQDTLAALNFLNEKLADFISCKNSADDSVFVKIYSEEPFSFIYHEKDYFGSLSVADSFFQSPIRTVIGPYLQDGAYKYAKITDRKLLSDSLRVSEIVFSFANVKTQGEAEAKRKLFDSVFIQLDSLKGNFASFAATFSDDANSKFKGGDIGWVKRNDKPEQYNNLLFYKAQKGKVYKTNTQNELIIFTITEDKPSKPGVQLAYFSKSIVPSPETERNIYAAASKFAAENTNEEKFKASASKLNVKVADNVRKHDFSVMGLGNAREVVRWAFNAKKGEISGIMTAEKKYIIACLTNINPKGLPDLESIKDRIKYDYLRDKKAEQLSKKLIEAKQKNIDETAKKIQKEVTTANSVTFTNPSLNGLMYEPVVAASALGAPANKLHLPVKGNAGVFAVEVISKKEAPPATDFTSYTQSLKTQIQFKSNRISDALKKMAKITDNRFDFF
ncbi:MAG: peptidylprolyl isomerase, partial [Chitinophagales bacterium]|nr:peptidylprolyl isomerase [Chitinophagales bacterium]